MLEDAEAIQQESSSTVMFRELRGEEFLPGLGRDTFTRRLAYFLGEVNALHPFREGNGRTQRVICAPHRCWVEVLGWVICLNTIPVGWPAAPLFAC